MSHGDSHGAKAGKAAKDDDLLLFGFDLSKLSPSNRFAFLTFGSLFCALTFAALQEKVFLVEGNAVVVVPVHTMQALISSAQTFAIPPLRCPCRRF